MGTSMNGYNENFDRDAFNRVIEVNDMILDEQESGKLTGERYTKLLYEQMLRSLYLTNTGGNGNGF